ncbi:MAG: hypothetical protein ACPGRE_04115 [Flavobacteriaceae bacterium]
MKIYRLLIPLAILGLIGVVIFIFQYPNYNHNYNRSSEFINDSVDQGIHYGMTKKEFGKLKNLNSLYYDSQERQESFMEPIKDDSIKYIAYHFTKEEPNNLFRIIYIYHYPRQAKEDFNQILGLEGENDRKRQKFYGLEDLDISLFISSNNLIIESDIPSS